MPFTPGERVKYLNEAGGGVVLRILPDNQVEVLDDDGLALLFAPSELVSPSKNFTDPKAIQLKLQDKSIRGGSIKKEKSHSDSRNIQDYILSSRKNWTTRNNNFIEVDLHIEELVAHPGRLRDGEKLILQLEHAAYCLNMARDAIIPKVILIHGVGAGVLRHELRQWLQGQDDLEFHNADFKTYGLGGTEVRLKGLHSA